MQSARLKNIIILILALLNLFLLGSLLNRQTARLDNRRQTVTQLAALFEANNIALPEDAVPFDPPPAGFTLNRDVEQERQMASFLLGKGMSHSSQSGVIYSYESSAGAAVFSSGGTFDAAILLQEDTNVERLCRKFCSQFQYDDLTISEGDSFSATAARSFDGCPVSNCTVSFSVRGSVLTVSGMFLPSVSGSAASSGELLSAVSALTMFLNTHLESGAVVSQITSVSACYQAQSTSASSTTLIPTWRVDTDFGTYYVNCETGAVTRK